MKSPKPVDVPAKLQRAKELFGAGNAAAALSELDSVLGRSPHHVEALGLAAQMSFSARMPGKAEQYARGLTRAQPRNDQAFFLLALTQSMQGRWLDSLESIDRALAIRPDHLDYVVGRAQTLVKLNLRTLAIEWYRKAIAIKPVPQFTVELSDVLLEESRQSEALALLEGLSINAESGPLPQVLLARAYTESQRFEEAEPIWTSARAASTDDLEWLMTKAKSEIASGRLHVAEGLLREGLERSPDSDRLFGMLASIVKVQQGDAKLVARMEDRAASGSLDAYARQYLSFALGKSFHDLGVYGKAMRSFDEANRLRAVISPNGLKFSRKEWSDKIDFQIRFFTKARLKDLSSQGIPGGQSLLVVGMIRSGTTLCEQILSCHSEICDGGEQTFWMDRGGEIIDPKTGKLGAKAMSLGREYQSILNGYGANARYVIDKNPLNVLHAPALHCLMPDVKMVHMLRSAIDNVLSIWMTPITTGLQFISTREDLVFAYREYLRLVSYLQDAMPEDRFKTFLYEQLTEKPDVEIASILRYLDVAEETACFHPELNPRTVRTPSVYQVRQPINTNSQARWKLYEPWLGAFEELLAL